MIKKSKLLKSILLLVCIFLPTLTFAANFNTNLAPGSRSEEVKNLQQFLIKKNLLKGAATGYFGDATKKAVQAFQKQNNLPSTGGWYALTRQKANALQQNDTPVSPPKLFSSNASSSKNIDLNPSLKNQNLTLTIENQGGLIYYSDQAVACYSFETCKKVYPNETKVALRAVPLAGYSFKGWSEAACGASLTCSVPLVTDTTVYARFEVISSKRAGKIVYPTLSDSCYIGLGHETCNLPIYWINDTGLDMSLLINDTQYSIVPEPENGTLSGRPINEESGPAEEPKNAIGPAYFTLTPEKYRIELRSGGQTLDKVTVEVKCAPGLYFKSGRTCWQDGAKNLFIFRQEGVLVKSDIAGIACGYKLERCHAAYPPGTKVTLTATTVTGYSFNGWTGACSGVSPTCTIIIDKDTGVGLVK